MLNSRGKLMLCLVGVQKDKKDLNMRPQLDMKEEKKNLVENWLRSNDEMKQADVANVLSQDDLHMAESYKINEKLTEGPEDENLLNDVEKFTNRKDVVNNFQEACDSFKDSLQYFNQTLQIEEKKIPTTESKNLEDDISETTEEPYQLSESSYVPETVLSSDESDIVINCQSPLQISVKGQDDFRTLGLTAEVATRSLAEQPDVTHYITKKVEQQNREKKKKRTLCKFCQESVTNFERHIVRRHGNEKEVREYLNISSKSQDGKNMRRKILAVMRYETEFEKFVKNTSSDNNVLPCVHCKKLLSANYLRRHHKKCFLKSINKDNKSGRIPHRALSQTLLACSSGVENTITTLRLRNEIFPKMRADAISMVAKKDRLIRSFGENYLKKHKRAQIALVCSNKMRECARLLIEVRRRTGYPNLSLFDVLNTNLFDCVIASGRSICGYDETSKEFKAPSLAMHLGTLLKQISQLCSYLIMKNTPGFTCEDTETKLKDLKRFTMMIETQWEFEIASLALKDLAEKKWKRPLKIPLTKDIIKFRDFIVDSAEHNASILKNNANDPTAFRKLIEATLVLTILFNRRRIGDVQYVTIENYLASYESTNESEFMDKLTESEKALTQNYKRVVAGGKGSRAIVMLFPKNLQNYIDLLLKIRKENNMVPEQNRYLFAYPGMENQWIRADVVIRAFALKSKLDHPDTISSNRLRKQIATLMQIINMTKDEYTQFAKFMGHTEQTHKDYYEITQDAYQTAKVSKLLTLFDKGKGGQYKGKSLDEIDLDVLDKDFSQETEVTLPATSFNFAPSGNTNLADEPETNDRNNHIDEDSSPIIHTIKGKRIRWTEKQKEIVRTYFKNHIKLRKPPKKDECLLFIRDNPDILRNLDWVKIKTFVFNTYNKTKK